MRLKAVTAILVLCALIGGALWAEDLPAGTAVLVLDSGAKLQSAVVVEKILDGYRLKLADDTLVEALQSDMALDIEVPPEKAVLGAKVAAQIYGEYFPGAIYEKEDDLYVITWTAGGADKLELDKLRLMLPPRTDPRPKPQVAAAPSQPAPSSAQAPALAPAPASPGTAGSPGSPTSQTGAPAAGGGVVPTPEADSPGSVLMGILGEAANSYAWVFSLKTPVVSKTLKYADAVMEVEFVPMDEKQLVGPYTWSFWLTNKSASPISVDWDRSYMTSLKGTKRATYHGDMKAINASAKQGVTVIQPKAKLGEALTPKDSVVIYHNKGYWNDKGQWVEPWDQIDGYQVFFGEDFGAAEGHEAVTAAVKGKEFKVVLAVLVGGALKNYEFTFRVEDIVKTTGQGFNFGQ